MRSWTWYWLRRIMRWFGMLGCLLVALHATGKIRAPDLPTIAPDVELRTIQGERLQLSSLRGRKVVLNFWATWCTPCRLEMPAIRRFHDLYPEIEVISITADGSIRQLMQAVEELEMTWTVSVPNSDALRAYGITSYPTTVVIDEAGRITAAHAGLLTDPQLFWLAW